MTSLFIPLVSIRSLIKKTVSLFQLLLGAKLTGVSTLLLAAVGGTRGKTGITLAADGLFAIVLLGQQGEGWVVDAASQSQDQMQSGFLLNVVITERAAVLELFAGKNQALLIGRNALLVLNFSFHIVNGVAGFDIERDCFTREGLDENLHGSCC